MAATVVLLHFNGDLTDVTGKTITGAGGIATVASPSKFGSGAVQVNSTTKYLSTPGGAHFNTAAGQSYTFEFFVYRTTATSYGEICYYGPSHLRLYVDNTGQLAIWRAGTLLGTWPGITANTWHHIAICQTATKWRLYIDGAYTANTLTTPALTSAATVYLVGAVAPIGSLDGYVDEYRFVKDLEAYTVDSNITVPTAEFPPPEIAITPAGFTSTAFGTPIRNAAAVPQGFTSTAFGQPLAGYRHDATIGGFTSTAFGAPTADQFFVARNVTVWPYGAIPTASFGTPSMFIPTTPEGIYSTRFGTPRAKTNQWSGVVSGFTSTVFGQPLATSHVLFGAAGFNSTAFGIPSAKGNVTASPAGFSGTRFGYPRRDYTAPVFDTITVFHQEDTITVQGAR